MAPETDIIIIADHDTNDRAKENGQTAAAEVQAKLKSLGIDCTALMPKEPQPMEKPSIKSRLLSGLVA